ncbi:hypothetical protein II906_12555, partial [bacterium]|nr:hypothetical protein [bacterium]
MGLAASQGRYLALTSRMSDLVYEGQQIAQQRLALAQETELTATKYAEAMSNTKLVINTINDTTKATTQVDLTYDILTSSPTAEGVLGLGRRLVDSSGRVVIPDESYKEYSIKYGDTNYS